MLFNVAFMVRRLMYSLTVVLLYNHGFAQIQLLFMMDIAMIIYQGWVEPFLYKWRDDIELTEEILILLSCYFLLLATPFSPNPEVSYLFGWINVFYFCFIFLLNLVLFLILKMPVLYRYLKLKYIRGNYLRYRDAHFKEVKVSHYEQFAALAEKRGKRESKKAKRLATLE